MEDLFREKQETVWVYMSKETVDDPYERNVVEETYAPIPIKAIIYTEFPEKLQWKYPGIKTTDAKGLVVRNKDLPTIRLSNKLTIGGNEYNAYRDNGNLTIYPYAENYTRVIVFRA